MARALALLSVVMTLSTSTAEFVFRDEKWQNIDSQCPTLPDVKNGDWDVKPPSPDHTYPAGMKATLTCHPDYFEYNRGSTNVTVECTDSGTWTHGDLDCLKACPTLKDPVKGARWSLFSWRGQGGAMLNCPQGYKLGIVCQDDGKWSDDLTCELPPNTCPPLPYVANAVYHPDGMYEPHKMYYPNPYPTDDGMYRPNPYPTHVGSKVTLFCSWGYKINKHDNSDVTIECLAGGVWSEDGLSCERWY